MKQIQYSVGTGNDVLFDTVHYHRQVNHEIECDKLVTESQCNYNYVQLFILQDLNREPMCRI